MIPFAQQVAAYLTGWLIVQPLYNRLLNAWRRRELRRPSSATRTYFREQARAIVDELHAYAPEQRPPVALEVIGAQHAEIKRLRAELERIWTVTGSFRTAEAENVAVQAHDVAHEAIYGGQGR